MTSEIDQRLTDIKSAVIGKLTLAVGKDPSTATERDWYVAAALALRDRVMFRWLNAERHTNAHGRKRVYYLSLEFLIGRLFGDVLGNLELYQDFELALGDLGVSLPRLRNVEADAALGNGGLGRLAACFMESMATLGVPAYGYGIRYDHGLFRQIIRDGWQQEFPEEWLSHGNPWELERPDAIYTVRFGGVVETRARSRGTPQQVWHGGEIIEALAYDIPIVGWRGHHVNALRLWSARAPDPLKLETFNTGDHLGAMSEQARAEAISKFLYPSDETPAGRELRLRQEYFFVSASLQDLLARHLRAEGELYSLAECAAIQLNDTHPAIAVAELMRLLVDIHNMPWDAAWDIGTRTLSYTNHTLLPEALERWPVELFERLLPRHLQIIYRINEAHLAAARAVRPGDPALLSSVSLIDEGGGRQVRMGHLAFVGSHRINGVSALHTDLMRQTVFRDLHELYPDRITNKTNGVTFRRWLMQANRGLTHLLTEVCGPAVLDDPTRLKIVAAHARDASFVERYAAVKRANKVVLARKIGDLTGVFVDPGAMFDVQIKRMHEYKRQLLNLIETIAVYQAILAEPDRDWAPRVKIFAGKAAASYRQAKLIIKMINDVAATINTDARIRGLLRVVFLPNYNVTLAETIIPAADVSEQISTAGMEASGTGNMKLALNGALTIGTLDGANVEILEHVGADNIFIFGMHAEEVQARRRDHGLDAGDVVARSPRLSALIDLIDDGAFSPGEPHRYAPIVHTLRHLDFYMVSADFDAYYDAQRSLDAVWGDRPLWMEKSILNVANMAWFSSDRTIREYAEDIWKAPVMASAQSNAHAAE